MALPGSGGRHGREPPAAARTAAFPPRMLGLDLGGARFNVRAAAIALRKDHVLVNRLTTDTFWFLPGGRVDLGETAAEALVREIREELGLAVRPGRLVFVVESFFRVAGTPFHEIAHYHLVDLPDAFPFEPGGGICHTARDAGGRLEFRWLPGTGPALADAGFQPAALRDRLAAPPAGPEHLVVDDLAGV